MTLIGHEFVCESEGSTLPVMEAELSRTRIQRRFSRLVISSCFLHSHTFRLVTYTQLHLLLARCSLSDDVSSTSCACVF
jgi:hypothetical protein